MASRTSPGDWRNRSGRPTESRPWRPNGANRSISDDRTLLLTRAIHNARNHLYCWLNLSKHMATPSPVYPQPPKSNSNLPLALAGGAIVAMLAANIYLFIQIQDLKKDSIK